jgi:hypothetical protein
MVLCTVVGTNEIPVWADGPTSRLQPKTIYRDIDR